MGTINTLNAHWPSLTDSDEEKIEELRYDSAADAADLALRTCSCGQAIDGFDDYIFHLKAIVDAAMKEKGAKRATTDQGPTGA